MPSFPLFALFLLIPGAALADMANGYLINSGISLPISIGMLFRGSILSICIVFATFRRYRAISLVILFFLAFFFLEAAAWAGSAKKISFAKDIEEFAQFLFPYLIIMPLAFFARRIEDHRILFRFIMLWGIFASLSIILSFVFGFGFQSYGRANLIGTKGLFKAQNDIGLSLVISLIATFQQYISLQKRRYLLAIIVITMGTFLIMSRAGIAGSILVWVSFIGFVFFSPSTRILSRPFLPMIGISVVFFTLATVFFAVFVSNNRYLANKFTSIAEKSPRHILEEAAWNRLNNRGDLAFWVGEGATGFGYEVGYNLNTNGSVLVEQDLLDAAGRYGVLGLILLWAMPVALAVFAYLIMLKNFNIDTLAIFVAMACYLGHGALAGHALCSPTVGHVIGPIYVLIFGMSPKLRPLLLSDTSEKA